MKEQLKDYQIQAAKRAREVLEKLRLAYIFAPPRMGKSLTALEATKDMGRVIVFTKKKALPGWEKYKQMYDFTVTNYEQIDKVLASAYSIIIIDEAHNFGAFPKASQRIQKFRLFCQNKPLLLLSGTPLIEGALKAYPQFSLSSYSPFKGLTAYNFFTKYGEPHKVWVGGHYIETYSKCRTSEIMKQIEPYIVRITYEDAQFNYMNKDRVEIINCLETRKLMKSIIRSQVVSENYDKNNPTQIQSDKSIPLETQSKQHHCLHRVCGGYYYDLQLPQSKLKWLYKFVMDHPTSAIAIMAYFIPEQENLTEIFKEFTNVSIMSSYKNAEGVDLSHYDYYILYSFGYSGAKFAQLRDRIVNINKRSPTEVIIPLLKGCVDEEIYRVVSVKKDFNFNSLKSLREFRKI